MLSTKPYTWVAKLNGTVFPGVTSGVVQSPSKEIALKAALLELHNAVSQIEIDATTSRVLVTFKIREVVQAQYKPPRSEITVEYFAGKDIPRYNERDMKRVA